MADKLLECRNVSKVFYDPVELKVLNDICLEVRKSEFISIVGRSGCGKSTLLYILSTMDTDYQGKLWIDQDLVTGKTEQKLAKIRNERIGFVFQFHYLINEFSVLQNVMLPALKLGRYSDAEIKMRALEKLRLVQMEQFADKKARLLSGGEKQRVAIARAMINDPAIIMGDEPTGNLDKKNADHIFDIFRELTTDYHQTLLIVTHSESFAEKSGRIVEMDDGRIISK